MDCEQFKTDPESSSVARSASHGGSLREHSRRTMAAWEQFVSGDDDVQGVSPSVLLSWYRCRDLYGVDPRQPSAPRAVGQGSSMLLHNSVFTQLGGIAAALVDRGSDCLSTVTDGDGRILASWGAGKTMRRAVDSNLAPFFAWSESDIGTNGMGTAMNQDIPMSVRGPEHWCEALHDWYCTGVAIYDSVTHEPVAVLNVSSCGCDVPVEPEALTGKTAIVRQELRDRALQDATKVTREFAEADAHTRGALIAIDIAGNVIATNERARVSLTGLPEGPVIDPDDRQREVFPELGEIARKSAQSVRSEPEWVGAADLGALVGTRNHIFYINPLHSPDGVIGLILSDERSDSGAEWVDDRTAAPGTVDDVPRRIPAVHAERILLLPPEEIRYAEAARHDVWLMTDRGRVRAATHGIDQVERELAPFGFMRVHRSYIVNLSRIREISERGNGTLMLSTDPRRQGEIAVSRRYAIKLRRQFGF